MKLFAYHLRLALRSLARDPGYSLTMVFCLGVAGCFWALAITHYVRMYGPGVKGRPTLHHLEIDHLRPGDDAIPITHQGQVLYSWRTRLSYGEYRSLAGSGIPSEEIALVRSQVVLARDGERPSDTVAARFVNAGFFAAFDRKMRWGSAWSAATEARGGGLGAEPGSPAPVVLSRATNAALFDGGSGVGRLLRLDGHPFVVIGVLAEDQPFRPDWDVAITGADQDGLYLPFAWFQRLHAWPSTIVGAPPAGSSFAMLLASNAYFVTFWVDLPTADRRAAFDRLAHEKIGRTGRAHTLRSFREFQRAFALAESPISFFAALGGLVLLAGGFNVARLQMAKTIARAAEVGIHRALGARRRGVFARQLIEAGVIAAAASALALGLALPFLWSWHALVGDADVPMRLTSLSAAIAGGAVFLVGVLSGMYPAWRLSRVPPTLAMRRV
jgi:putative ABC transport system permease protein